MNLFEGMSLQLKVLHPGPSTPSACWLRSRKQEAMQLSQDQLLELSLTRPEKDKPWRERAGTVARTGANRALRGQRAWGNETPKDGFPPDAPGSPLSVDWKLKDSGLFCPISCFL